MTRYRIQRLLLCSLVFCGYSCGGGGGGGSTPPLPPTPGPVTYSVQETFNGLSFQQPVALVQNPIDNVWYIVERRGRVFSYAVGEAASSLAIDVQDRVNSTSGELGLLGLAFHPDVSANGAVYLSYTADGDQSRLSYFAIDSVSRMIDPGSEQILATVVQPFDNHNGGHIIFEPGSNNILWGLGDGGSAGDPGNRAQNTFDWLGSILRLDLTTPNVYAIPTDNPFFGGSGGLEEIYVYGLRNPWRFNFDSQTGDLWIGNVGQNALEEIDIAVPGGNYGWRCFEGTQPFVNDASCPDPATLQNPVATYGRNEGQSVTGGFVYRGTAMPELVGAYIFADFISGRIWSLTSVGGAFTRTLLVDTDINISSFAQDSASELYLLGFDTSKIYRLISAQ